MDEAAGAADATACSRDGYFLSYKICVLSDTRLRCAVPTFLDDLASSTPEAIKRRNDHSIPINKDMTGPHPPQTPPASSKSPYRKCPGGTQSGPRGYTAPAHLRYGPKILRQLSSGALRRNQSGLIISPGDDREAMESAAKADKVTL